MMNERPDVQERRNAPRTNIEMPGFLRASGCNKVAIVLKDISEIGFCCEHASELRVGEQMWLKFADFDAMEVSVVRRDGYYYGLVFARPLHVAVLDHVVSRYARLIT